MYYLFCLVDSGGMRIDRSLRVFFAKDDTDAEMKAYHFMQICREAGFHFTRVVIDRLGERVYDEDWAVLALMNF